MVARFVVPKSRGPMLKWNELTRMLKTTTTMAGSDVYFFEIEIEALEGSEMLRQSAGHAAVVAAFVRADTIQSARISLREQLSRDHYRLRSEHYSGLHDDFEWDDDVQEQYDSFARRSRKEGVVFGEFSTWDES